MGEVLVRWWPIVAVLALLGFAASVWRAVAASHEHAARARRLSVLRFSLAELDAMDDRQFEFALRNLLIRGGWSARQVGQQGDQAADGSPTLAGPGSPRRTNGPLPRGGRTVFDEDGSLDPFLKFLLYAVLVLAAGNMLWDWLTGTVIRWITVGLWGAVAAHPWWTVLIMIGFLAVLFLLARLADTALDLLATPAVAGVDTTSVEPEPALLTYRMKQLEAMSPAGFEHACAELLGADVIATDADGLTIVVQCKQLNRPVNSPAMQQFNGTARPEHGADHAVIIGLNGFTQPALDFASRHRLITVGREDLKRWAHGTHLYDVIRARTTP
ncbi:restriction endonuclease [Streptomyces sp. NPDC007863]|uniref:restriction endonuclease n=1 Tax=Streptomyces sp. NPDC007863 TaxID=3154894 RepID=UPI0033E2AE01